jgi:hypothetical protein
VTAALRFVAPSPVLVESLDKGARGRHWATAFTSLDTLSQSPTRYLHRCRFFDHSGPHGCAASVTWQLESQLLSTALSIGVHRTEGKAETISAARDKAVATALLHHVDWKVTPDNLLSPAFIAMPTLPWQPRIWVSGAEVDAPATAGLHPVNRLCIIRERLHRTVPSFSCSLEELEPDTGISLRHWICSSLQEATQSGCDAILEHM